MIVIGAGRRVIGALLAFAVFGLPAAVAGPAGAASLPVNTEYPSIPAPIQLGKTVTASPGVWTGDPAPTYSYQWQRCFPVSPPTSSVLGSTGADPVGIALDRSGNVFAVNRDSRNITRISTTGTVTTYGSTGTRPVGIAVDGAGNAYTANQEDDNITKITRAGVSTTFGSTGSTPTDIAVDSAGNVYTTNQFSDNVTKRAPGGGLTVVGTTGGQPIGLAFDPAGNIYTANFGTDDVSKIVPGGTSTILGPAGKGPVAVALDPEGNVYASNSDSNNVSRITPGGVSTIFGSAGNSPGGIAIDADGNLLVANYFSSNVTKITPGGVSSVLGSTGNGPFGLVLDGAGNIYTTNGDSNSITKITRTNCLDLEGVTSQTYTPVPPDQGRKLRVVVTAANSEGVVAVPSSTTEQIAPSGIRARLSKPVVAGPRKVRRGQTVSYEVTVRNTGKTRAEGVRIRFAAPGLRLNAPAGSIAPGRSRTVRLGVGFRRSGQVRASIRASAGNADTTRTTKRIRVVG